MLDLVVEEEAPFSVDACGCTVEYVNGRYINILCDEHELEYQEMQAEPLNFKKTKMRRAWEL